MNKCFLKLCNTVDYNDYTKTEMYSFISGTMIQIARFTDIYKGTSIDVVESFIQFYFYLVFIILFVSKGSSYTSDINEIKILYNEFIDNYIKLNKDFSLTNPIEIFTMFNYLLKNGYLSKNKTYKHSKVDIRDLDVIKPVNIFNGRGVCRHVSPMLCDIFDKLNIENKKLGVNFKLYKVELKPLNKNIQLNDDVQISTYKKYLQNIHSEKTYQEAISLINSKKIDLDFDINLKLEGRLFGQANHVINYVSYDDKSYFLDATNNIIFHFIDKEKKILGCDYGQCFVVNKLNKNMKRDSIPLEEENKMIVATKKLCEENLDIFNSFYKNNEEIYKEAGKKLEKIKKHYIFT